MLFSLLLIVTITGCKTIENDCSKIRVPETPEREIIPSFENNVELYAYVISYYETLVEKWEEWGRDVNKIIDSYKN